MWVCTCRVWVKFVIAVGVGQPVLLQVALDAHFGPPHSALTFDLRLHHRVVCRKGGVPVAAVALAVGLGGHVGGGCLNLKQIQSQIQCKWNNNVVTL